MSFIWHKFERCSKCAMSTVTVVVAYVIKTVFSCVNVISLCGDRCVLVSSVDVGVCVC